MQMNEVHITITNEDGGIFAVHEIKDFESAMHLLGTIDPLRFELPIEESDSYLIDDLITACMNAFGIKYFA